MKSRKRERQGREEGHEGSFGPWASTRPNAVLSILRHAAFQNSLLRLFSFCKLYAILQTLLLLLFHPQLHSTYEKARDRTAPGPGPWPPTVVSSHAAHGDFESILVRLPSAPRKPSMAIHAIHAIHAIMGRSCQRSTEPIARPTTCTDGPRLMILVPDLNGTPHGFVPRWDTKT